MERQFLISLLLLFLIVGCETTPVLTIKNNSECITTYSDNECITSSEESLVVFKPLPSDVWEYMIFNSDYEKDFILDQKTLSYINRHIQDLEKFNDYLNKSYYFIYYVIQELEAANLPVELALIPFVESNYDPFSISPSGAVGLWQFMPKTGRIFNLEKSWWSEDRHDPFRSTHAAIGYFKYLFERFDNDIYLALAAYNAGPTYLDRQIKKNYRRGMDTDFWSLSLNSQVTEYIPKYVALREVVFNSEKYNVNLPFIPVESVVQKIEIPGQVEILTLSEYLDIKPELIYKLNAGYTKWASAPKDKSIFYVPIEKTFLLDSPDSPFENVNQINWISHVVVSGDSLWKLAKKYDTEIRIIKEINYIDSDLLSINDTLLIPLSKSKSNNFIPYEMHIVSEGDTLWDLSKKYNIDIEDLIRMNSLKKDSYLQLGQQLTIGNKNIHRNIESKKRTILYSVKQGDNLYKISDLFDVTVESIKEINDFETSDLMPGQIIKIAIRAF
ncbi:LysM peptidoglycan-binding domain-containing protein [Gammaproteobacteria bacterium]|jgi:membrane-bound lytic murein transglycosylase D|nr:LysM peptidoglycan-binding domain-containing protein [Gammaproteobacteria bacterium]MDC1007854.1 LysM peptidoglycan-binding domain-containing protein [Gammaproteobacteria bacterium]MDC3217150.1 LysM peptidoglycan-binding domain-containing protein [Gammaproteobacteria bacterium]|tara:strand:+ start:155 stop:1651 length:1497 start_codon:yes stop_codon:yes gene_type:complete